MLLIRVHGSELRSVRAKENQREFGVIGYESRETGEQDILELLSW